MPQMGLIWSFKRYMILAVFMLCFMFFLSLFGEKVDDRINFQETED